MNSLENLNNWANDGLVYGDQSPYSITFDAASATNQNVSFVEDQSFVSPVGINITSLVSTPGNIEYTIDLSTASYEASIDWGDVPYYITREVAGTNIFKIVGTIDADAWNALKNPTITILDQGSDFTYTATISYPDPSNTENTLTKSWTISATVTSTPEISTATDWVYTKNSTGTIDGTPEILNTAPGNYTLVVEPSDTSYVYLMSSTGTGGTSTFNPITKTLTLVGSVSQVNSHLANIAFTPGTNVYQVMTMSYELTNPSGAQSVVTQTLSPTGPYGVAIATYVEDSPFSLGYEILDQSATATSFTISVEQTTPLPSVSAGYFTVNGSNVGTTWSTTNTKANINAANVVYQPPVDYTGTLTFTVNQSKVDAGVTENQVIDESVNVINVGTNNEIVNMIDRSYSSNTVNSIFSTTTPYISDGIDAGQLYTITLTSSLGKFGNSAANAIGSSSYSFTGNKTACNAEFSNMVFVPNKGTSSSGTFNYKQVRSGVTQVNQDLNLTGTLVTFPVTTLTYSGNTTFTPTFNQAYYGTANVTLIGGGGAGVYARKYSSGGLTYVADLITGGGGAGQFRQVGNISLTVGQSYPIVVGAGGKSGNTTASPQNDYTQILAGRTQGGNTTALGYQANGGQTSISNYEWAAAHPGQTMPNDGHLLVAGNEGSGTYTGGSAYRTLNNGTRWAMGGGAGATGNGGNGTVVQQPSPLSPIGYPGAAGPGITYNGTTYCVGGPGNISGGSTTAGSGGVGSGVYGTTTFSSSLFADGKNGLVIIKIT